MKSAHCGELEIEDKAEGILKRKVKTPRINETVIFCRIYFQSV